MEWFLYAGLALTVFAWRPHAGESALPAPDAVVRWPDHLRRCGRQEQIFAPHGYLPAYRRDLAGRLRPPDPWRAGGIPLRRVRRRRRLFADAVPHLHRRAACRRGRLLGEPARRRFGLGRARALAARACRSPDGPRAARRRPRRLGDGRLALRAPATYRPDRSDDQPRLYATARHARNAHAGGELARVDARPPRRQLAAQAASAYVAARPSLQNALPALEALYQRALAAGPRVLGRRALGD